MGTDLRFADFTGRARIRHAALQLFSAGGYAQTSLRAIAQKAEVSLALISHHFGSKHQLRDAVDAWVLAMFEKAAADASERRDGAAGDACEAFAAALGRLLGGQPEIRAYLRRMAVVDAAPNGAALVGALLAITRRLMKRSLRPDSEQELDGQSLRFLLLVLGPALLEPVLKRCVPGLFEEGAAPAPLAPDPRGGHAPARRPAAGWRADSTPLARGA